MALQITTNFKCSVLVACLLTVWSTSTSANKKTCTMINTSNFGGLERAED